MRRKCARSQKFRRLHIVSLIFRSILAVSCLALIEKHVFHPDPSNEFPPEQEALDNAVADHYRSLGAVLRAKIGRSCLQPGSRQQPCLRGLIATETFKPGDIVFALPIHLIHYLNESGAELDSRVSAPDEALPERLAYNFAVDVYGDGAFNATHKLWFESMQRNCIANIYKATYDELSLLEMPELIKNIKKKVDSLREIHGALDGVIRPHVTWEQFLDIRYMVETRRMKIQSKQGIIPLFDYVNNAETLERADLLFFANGTHVGFAARTHLLNGTEMRWNYKGEFQAAPDTIFINWQYVTENTSVLFSVDEQEVFKLSGTHTEMRLSYIRYIDGILGSFSTSYSEDRKDLRNTDPSSLSSLFIQLRMLRKKILMAKRAELKRVLVLSRLISFSERMISIRGFLAMVFTSFYKGLDSPT
ncbi:hypothetical protein M9435_006772 [Picochlorum sp. BPE23]|nr:hypothetical protein M9435_006772 [Picochlorum sp. BPE23]